MHYKCFDEMWKVSNITKDLWIFFSIWNYVFIFSICILWYSTSLKEILWDVMLFVCLFVFEQENEVQRTSLRQYVSRGRQTLITVYKLLLYQSLVLFLAFHSTSSAYYFLRETRDVGDGKYRKMRKRGKKGKNVK